jgi:hypothetical protein
VGVELHVFAGSCRYLFGPKKIRRAKQNAHTNRHLHDLLGPAAFAENIHPASLERALARRKANLWMAPVGVAE